jgi:hypothetical protein
MPIYCNFSVLTSHALKLHPYVDDIGYPHRDNYKKVNERKISITPDKMHSVRGKMKEQEGHGRNTACY